MPTQGMPLSLRLDPAVKTRLQQEASRVDRSLSYVVQNAIVAFLDAKDQKRQIIADALAEADKGIFISAENMSAWVESWGNEGELAEPTPDLDLNAK
jgi:predicted transcriptional regulator